MVNRLMLTESIKEEEDQFENWFILEGVVVSTPVKDNNENNIFYNFRIDNGSFRMNCTITVFQDNDRKEKIEEDIFSSIKLGTIIKVAGKFFTKKKNEKLRNQINVKTWISSSIDNKKIKYSI